MQLKKTPFVLAVIVCGAGAISVAAQTTSSPYSGTPIALPATASFEASKFDKGGQGVAYKDLTQGNAGGQFRTTKDVDIIASTDAPGGPYAINNFQTGEWLAYTVNVAESKNYDLAIRASSNQTTPAAFHIEVDGANVTGSIAVPKTATWTTFQWVVGKQNVPLTAGKHVLKVVSEQQYFNINAIRATLSAAQPTTPPPAGETIPARPIPARRSRCRKPSRPRSSTKAARTWLTRTSPRATPAVSSGPPRTSTSSPRPMLRAALTPSTTSRPASGSRTR